MRKLAISFIACILCFCISVPGLAYSLADTEANTSMSGWAYSTQSGHMGQKASTYSFESSSVYSEYSSYVTAGKALWGANVSMTYTPSQSSATGIFSVTDAQVNYNAATAVTGVSNGHRTAYSIVISSINFNDEGNDWDGKIRTIAHEIGHAYGLGHVSNSSNIMYDTYSSTKYVTAQDIWGMKVVTHVHVHSASTTGTVYQYDQSYHKVICSSCKGIYKQLHTFNGRICTTCGYRN